MPLTVAAKKPGCWIVRAMCPFSSAEKLRAAVERHVGTLDLTIESTYTYGGWPGYVVYGKGDLQRLGWPTGVFKFEWVSYDSYNSPAVQLGPIP